MKMTKEEAVSLLVSMMGGMMDFVAACLPPTISVADFKKRREAIRDTVHGAVQGCGSAMSAVCAAIVNDGVQVNDHKEWAAFVANVDEFVEDCGGSNPPVAHPDPKPHAEALVDAIFPRSYFAGWQTDGFDLSDEYFCLWPDNSGTIRVIDSDGNKAQILEMDNEEDAPRWKELRDMMPDDALYFQPEGAGDEDAGTASKIKSYEVYRDRANCEKAHPDCETLAFCWDDIEEPKFLDVPNPVLFGGESDEDENDED